MNDLVKSCPKCGLEFLANPSQGLCPRCRTKLDMGGKPQVPPIVTNCRRRRTTVLGVIILTLACIGLIFSSGFEYLAMASGRGVKAGPSSTMVIRSVLVVLTKIALSALGICLIRRIPWTRVVAFACLILSLIDSSHYLLKVVPLLQAGRHPTLATAMSVGAWIVLVVPAFVYIGILFYLDRPASRKEFQDRNV